MGYDTVPEREKDIREFLAEIAKGLNCPEHRAEGNLEFCIQEPDASEENWIITVEGQVSGGHDNDGIEIWKDTELRDSYSGTTLKEAAEELFSDYKSNYC